MTAYAKLSTSDGEFYLGLEGQKILIDGAAYVRPMQATTPLMSRNDMGGVECLTEDSVVEELLFRAEGIPLHEDAGTGHWVFVKTDLSLDGFREIAEGGNF